MLPFKHTTSFCPTCYQEIGAAIRIEAAGVFMEKACPEHGRFSAMLERDPLYYTYIVGLHARDIYAGHMVDITRTCNLRCEFCYYPLEKKDPEHLFSVESILNEITVNRHRAPIILSGGEPTLHPKLAEIIAGAQSICGHVHAVELLSNGVRLAEPEYFQAIIPMLTSEAGVCSLNLSLHRRETDKWKAVIEQARQDQIKLGSALIVVDGRQDFLAAIELCKSISDVVQSFRIKACSSVWNEQKPGKSNDGNQSKIFVSDMLNWLDESGSHPKFILRDRNKPMFCNVAVDGMHLMLVAWHDVWNIDLQEINTPPTYRARNGEVCNIITAEIINEGMQRGWLKGVRMDHRKESILP